MQRKKITGWRRWRVKKEIELGCNAWRTPRAPPSILGGKWMRRGLSYNETPRFWSQARAVRDRTVDGETAGLRSAHAVRRHGQYGETGMSRVVCIIGRKIGPARPRQVGSGEAEARLRAAGHRRKRKLQAELKVLTGKVARLEGDVEKLISRKFSCWKMKKLEWR